MKVTKRIIKAAVAFVLTAVLSVLAFGCAGYEPQSGILPENYIPQPDGKIKLNYYIASNESLKKAINDYVRTFQQKYPDVSVTTELSNKSKEQVAAEIAAKTVGDVLFLFESDVYN